MKKNLFIPFLVSVHFAFAGTGGAHDASLFMLSIIAIMSIVLAVLYSIDFIRRFVKELREKKITHLTDEANSENIV
jgi:hypothetical protein